jgi:3-phosphoglycerate kinase
VINTENAVKALKLMNGGNMFDIVHGPKVSREAVEKLYCEDFAKIFDDCNGCIGLALDYVVDKEFWKDMTARDFTEMMNRIYLENSCLVDEITREEYIKAPVKVDK